MKVFLAVVCFLAGGAFQGYAASRTDSLLLHLNAVLKEKEVYTNARLERINRYRQALEQIKDPQLEFGLLQRLADEYKTFVYDSAFVYIQRLKALAQQVNDPVKIAYAKVELGFVLLSSGMFKETLDSLGTLKVQGLPDSIRLEYYSLLARAYYDLGDFDRDRFFTPGYTRLGSLYIDSAVRCGQPDSYDVVYLKALRNLKNENTTAALADLNRLLDSYPLTPHQLAVTTSTLSYFYISREQPDQAIDLLARAAIADITTATRETAAISSLAELLYKKGDIRNAYTFIQQAMEDAIFYGARQRRTQVGSILPVIAAARLTSVDEQRRLWLTYSVALTVLAILAAVFAISTLRQLKKRKIAEKALLEANKIKEEYIGYYFNVNSEYLGKIEALKKAVEMKLMTRKPDDIKYIVSSINLKKEREELYHSFDKVFVKLFPDFVTTFNSYFKGEDRIVLKEGQLLNTELRIFALIRLGINDPEKIARILDYSIHTIYNYKARIKGKSLIPNEQFEHHVMQIQTLTE